MSDDSHTKKRDADERITFRESAPLLFMHLACLGIFWVGFSRAALIALLITYFVRVFALTAGYHRYFSHKSFKTSRAFQFILALLAGSAAQLGPLWWASHHRWHHRSADTREDIHSPSVRGFLWSHVGWILCKKHARTRMELVKDFAKYPELVWLDKHPMAAPGFLAALMLGLGALFARTHPEWNTSGPQMLVWGFFVSTVLVYHATFCINSLMHMFGSRRYDTPDTSRNNPVLALLTMGEGWHNNHHRYAVCARQGFFWWEIDLSYYVLKMLSWVHVVWDLQAPPASVYTGKQTS